MSRKLIGPKGAALIVPDSRSIRIQGRRGIVAGTGDRRTDNAIARRIIGSNSKPA